MGNCLQLFFLKELYQKRQLKKWLNRQFLRLCDTSYYLVIIK